MAERFDRRNLHFPLNDGNLDKLVLALNGAGRAAAAYIGLGVDSTPGDGPIVTPNVIAGTDVVAQVLNVTDGKNITPMFTVTVDGKTTQRKAAGDLSAKVISITYGPA